MKADRHYSPIFDGAADGKYASDWADLAPGRHASHRATTSSRTPGRVNRGTVYACPVVERVLHIHTCGCAMHLCAGCKQYICEATGHAKHACHGVK